MIVGLQSEVGQALNGSRGLVKKFDSRMQRFAVKVDGIKDCKLLKPDNLEQWAMSNNRHPKFQCGRIYDVPQVGDTVRIHGLTSALGQVLNGCMGRVVRYDV